MTNPEGTRNALAWCLWGLTTAFALGTVGFAILNRDTGIELAWPIVLEVGTGVVVITFATVGALVARRRPGHPIGWILLAAALLATYGAFAEQYAIYALYTDSGGLPGGTVMAWTATWVYIPSLLTAPALLFLLFPDGRVPGPRWRPVLWLLIVATLAATMDAALAPVMDDIPFVGLDSPVGFAVPQTILDSMSSVGWPGMALGLVLSALAMIGRMRRSHGAERQQLKWIATAAAVFPIVSIAGVASYYVGRQALGSFLVTLAFLPIPIAAGSAILRYRLYDLDIVINRALVYGIVSAILAGAYFSLALVLGALGLIAPDSNLAVALSTLAVAGLFGPVRRRVQDLVDRRFYRQKYDAARTLEAFASLLAHFNRPRGPTDRAGRGRVGNDAAQPCIALGENAERIDSAVGFGIEPGERIDGRRHRTDTAEVLIETRIRFCCGRRSHSSARGPSRNCERGASGWGLGSRPRAIRGGA